MISFLTIAVLTLSANGFLVKRTVEDGAGDEHAPGAHLHWSYNGASGPLFWPEVAPACAGKIQSPINIEPNTYDFATTLQGVLNNPNGQYPNIVWPTSAGTIKNLGDTLKFTPKTVTGSFDRGNANFSMIQWHIHMPSEHRINGVEYAGEIHFCEVVHQSAAGALAVVGGFVELGEVSSPIIASLAAAKDLAVGAYMNATIDYKAAIDGFKASPKYYRYTGSLTAPPCLEGVKWLVAHKPVFTATVADYNFIKSKVLYNARETMPLFDVYDADWAAKRISDYFVTGAAPAASGH